MKEKYSKENLSKLVKDSKSIAQVIQKLKDKGETSKPETIKKYIQKYNLDVSHFTGQRWNKSMSINHNAQIPLEKILQEGINYRGDTLKKRLIEAGLLEYKCKCGNTGEWLGKPIVLELHHINGNHFDNRLENLQILCPNCHSQTNSYRKKKTSKNEGIKLKKKHNKICLNCQKDFQADRDSRQFCSRKCYIEYYATNNIGNAKVVQIDKSELEKQCNICKTISELAIQFNTSTPTIRKYLKQYNLYETFKNKYSSHVEPII